MVKDWQQDRSDLGEGLIAFRICAGGLHTATALGTGRETDRGHRVSACLPTASPVVLLVQGELRARAGCVHGALGLLVLSSSTPEHH